MMMVVGLALSRFLLVLVDTPEDVLERALVYLRIYCVGMAFIIPYNFGAAILRSIGDTRRPLYCLIASGVLNICLNLFLVIVFHLGVAGVAIATVISNICIQTAINSFGSSAVAGMTAALNFEYIGYFIVSAFSQTVVTFIGQNYGARQYERCRKILHLCMVSGMIGTFLVSSVFILACSTVIRIFTVDPAENEYAMARFLYAMPFLFLTSTYEIVGSALRGMGRSTLPAVFTLLGTVVFRVFWFM